MTHQRRRARPPGILALTMAIGLACGAAQAQIQPPAVFLGEPEQASLCPDNFNGQSTGATLSCTCPGNADGNVWGSGPYAADSAICVAARHAGVVGAGGGEIQVAGTTGCERYIGSTANGIATYGWDDYGVSFVFPAAGRPQCPVAQTVAIHFVGLRCLDQADQFFLEDTDTVFAIAGVAEENGAVSGATILPGAGEYFERVQRGDIRSAYTPVWRGAAQDVTLFGGLYKFDPVMPDLAATFVSLNTGLAGAFIAIGSGGAGTAAGVAVATLGQAAAAEVREELGNRARMLGDTSSELKLDRWFGLAGQPTLQVGNIGYHFATTHQANGGHYELYWLVTR
ncbi:MAG: LCCL domain-containing protein [Alphaproteobacteria bacterium]